MTGFPLLDYAAARSAGEIAASACADKAARGGWDREGAKACILEALGNISPLTGEQLVDWARENDFAPHDDRAFGPIFASLLRAGLIVKVGHCKRRRGNGTNGGSVYARAKVAA